MFHVSKTKIKKTSPPQEKREDNPSSIGSPSPNDGQDVEEVGARGKKAFSKGSDCSANNLHVLQFSLLSLRDAANTCARETRHQARGEGPS